MWTSLRDNEAIYGLGGCCLGGSEIEDAVCFFKVEALLQEGLGLKVERMRSVAASKRATTKFGVLDSAPALELQNVGIPDEPSHNGGRISFLCSFAHMFCTKFFWNYARSRRASRKIVDHNASELYLCRHLTYTPLLSKVDSLERIASGTENFPTDHKSRS